MTLNRAVVGLLFLAGGAFAQDVSYNFDKTADFSKYKTYRWVEIKVPEQLDEITRNQLMAAFDAQLVAKGLQKVTSEDADLYLAYQFGFRTEKELNSFSSGWGPGNGWGGGWYGYGGGGMSTTTATTSTIHVGTIALDMYDVGTKALVWRGLASKTLNMKAKPEKRQKNIDKGAKKLLKTYPPVVKS